jgi:hypothetical protein
MAYSPFFETLHDERAPVGRLGRGTHYSVVRTVLPVWSGSDPAHVEEETLGGARRSRLELFDLAIIWDEDHDERVWGVIQRLHVAGLLAPVRFIGERKGNITILLAPEFDYGDSDSGVYEQLVERVVDGDAGDSWALEIHHGITGDCGIIHAEAELVEAYLRGIQACWKLGPCPWVAPKQADSAA